MKNLYVVGTGYYDLIKLIDAINKVEPTWKLAGFIETKRRFSGNIPFDYPLFWGRSKLKDLAQDENNYFFLNKTRNLRMANFLEDNSCNIASLIHPGIDINHVEIGKGCIIPEGCIIGGFTKIGNYVTVRLKSLISHDVIIEDHVFIGPGASIGGGAMLKKRCFIGLGAIVMGERVIGEGSVVGAGAVVTKDVPPGTVVAGIPAKPMEIKP